MKGYKVMTGIMLVLLAIPFIGRAFANVGPGILDAVIVCPTGGSVGVDGNGMFKVTPGDEYCVVLTNIANLPPTINVWIAGSYYFGGKWQLPITATNGGSGTTYTSECFTIPEDAGCTITVHYNAEGTVAASKYDPSQVGHMKTYLEGQPVPCEPELVPELPLGPEVFSAIGLLALSVITRKRRK